jgi:putative FmdB family regulatory protein
MPIYEYICDGCGKALELLVADSKAKPACPHCGSRKLSKQFSSFAAHQGSGGSTPCQGGACPAAPAGGCGGGRCPLN